MWLHYVLAATVIWMIVEVLFYFWYRRSLRMAQPVPCRPAYASVDSDWMLDRIINRPEALDLVAGWLRASDLSIANVAMLTRENVMETMAAQFFSKNVDELTLADEEWCNNAVDMLCAAQNATLSTQPNDFKCMKTLLDPVVATWRPFAIYVGIMALQFATSVVLRLRGYRRYTANTVNYWYLDGKHSDALLTSHAMVFFHGVGVGLTAYISLLCHGITCGQQFVFESPSIAMDLFAAPMDSPTLVRAVEEAFVRHKVNKATFVGHSFGSVYVAWVLRKSPEIVQRVVLIDPVSILLCMSDICYNFLYRKHNTLLGMFVNHFASRELGISIAIRRHLYFTETCLFSDMLPPDSVVLLSEYDHIVPTRAIYVDLCKMAHKSVQTVVMSNMQHGMALAYREKRRLIVDAINGEHLNPKDMVSCM